VPPASSAQAKLLPTETAVAVLMPETATGVVEHEDPLHVCGPLVVPLPSSPWLLPPQHSTLPPVSSAQADPPLKEMAVAPLRPETATGVVEHGHPLLHVCGPLLVPLPS
jgi:hypothetical protein